MSYREGKKGHLPKRNAPTKVYVSVEDLAEDLKKMGEDDNMEVELD